MTLLGLAAQQLALIFAVAGVALTTLYLLKQQRRRVDVPFIKLWQQVLQRSEATSWWRRLLRLLSLLIQLLVLALLVASLGDPRLGRSQRGRTLVLLVDASASMQARLLSRSDREVSRLQAAQAQAREFVRSLGGDDLAVVVALDGQPAPLGGLSYDEHELFAQIDAVTARDTGADLPSALELSRALLAGRPNPTVVLFSDGGFEESSLEALTSLPAGGIDVRFLPLPVAAEAAGGAVRGNAAISALSVRRYRRNRLSYEVLVRLLWFPAPVRSGIAREGLAIPTAAQRVTLELRQDGEVVDVQTLDLSPGQAVERIYNNLSGAGRNIEARIKLATPGSVDILPIDDRAFTVLPERRQQRVLIVTRGNLFLEGALLATGAGEENHLIVERVAPAAYDAARAERYDAIIFDAYTPKAPPNAHAIYLDPQGPDSPFPVAGTVKSPLLTDVDAAHPALRWVSLTDVNMSRSSAFTLQPGDRPLASMFKQALVVAREESTRAGLRRSLALGFDLRQSDLPLRVAFPLLLMNTLDWFAGEVDEDLGSRRTGQIWRIPLSRVSSGAGASSRALLSSANLLLPDGELLTTPVSEGYALHYGQRVGFYELSRPDGVPQRFAGNLSDPTESAALLRGELRAGNATLRPPEAGERALRRVLWPYLLLAVLFLLALEWWSYHRRWTV
jgi:hypothetical protein